MSPSSVRLHHLIVGGAAVAMAATGDRPLVDAAVVFGLAFIAPLAVGRPTAWVVGAVGASGGVLVDHRTISTALVVPALVVAAATFVTLVRPLLRRAREHGGTPDLVEAGLVLASLWAAVAVLSLMAGTAELRLLDIREPIVRLTAVHYLYAGMGSLVVAVRLVDAGRGHRSVGTVAVLATAGAPPVVAAGFVLDHPVPQIGGAVVMTIGVWTTAVLLLAAIPHEPRGMRRALLTAAGLAPWAPMALAVAWAAAQHLTSVPALSVPDMARIHGTLNGFGFVLLGLLATRGASSYPKTARSGERLAS